MSGGQAAQVSEVALCHRRWAIKAHRIEILLDDWPQPSKPISRRVRMTAAMCNHAAVELYEDTACSRLAE
jgi:hypothetical protein